MSNKKAKGDDGDGLTAFVVLALLAVIIAGLLGYKTPVFNYIKSALKEPIQYVEEIVGYFTPISQISDSTLMNLQYHNLERYWVVLKDGKYVDYGDYDNIFDDYSVELDKAYQGDLNGDDVPDVIVKLIVTEGNIYSQKLCFIMNKDGTPIQTQIMHFTNQYIDDVLIKEEGWFDVDTREYTGTDPRSNPSLFLTRHYRYQNGQILEYQADVHGQVMQR